MKKTTPIMRQMLDEQYGSSPTIVVGVRWRQGMISYYATKRVDDAGIYCKGIIKSIGDISVLKRADNAGTTGSVSMEIYDTDGEFKNIMDLVRLEGTQATVFQHFDGLKSTDWFPLLYGRICNPIWDEGSRVFSCTIEARVVSAEVGFSPTPDDFGDLAKDAYGVPWPLLFGEVLMSPCTHVRRRTEGTLKTAIRLESAIYRLTGDKKNVEYVPSSEIDVISYFDTVGGTYNQIYVAGGENFPQGISIKIEIEGVIFEGSFSGDIFSVTSANLPKYENLPTKTRPSDPDQNNPRVGWLKDMDFYPNLVGMTVLFRTNGQPVVNKVVRQDKGKFWLKYPFYSPDNYFSQGEQGIGLRAKLLNGQGLILKAFACEPSGLKAELSEFNSRVQTVSNQRLATQPGAKPNTTALGLNMAFLDRIKGVPSAWWSAEAGVKVRMFSDNDPDIYVMSLVQLQEVYSVYGKKKVKLGEHEHTTFAPIPQSYYTIQLQSNYAIKGSFASALLFKRPLADYNTDTEKWEDVVYISARSSVGPNTAQIIEWLITHYTDYFIDSSSFGSITLPYDSNFGIYERKDCLQICNEIAWQARCALLVDSDAIEIRYLAEEPSSLATIDEDTILSGTLQYTTTQSHDVITRLVGTWRETQEWTEPPTRLLEVNRGAEIRDIIRAMKETQRRETPATNVNVYERYTDFYGVVAETKDIFIYNFEEPVQKCLEFWGLRTSGIWKLVKFKTTLSFVNLQPFDCVTFATDILGPVKGIVEEVRYSPKDKEVDIQLWLPIEEGTFFVNDQVWNG